MSAKRIAFIKVNFWRFVVSRFDQPEDADDYDTQAEREADSPAIPTRPTLQLRRQAKPFSARRHCGRGTVSKYSLGEIPQYIHHLVVDLIENQDLVG